jgi:hypothetical protein
LPLQAASLRLSMSASHKSVILPQSARLSLRGQEEGAVFEHACD